MLWRKISQDTVEGPDEHASAGDQGCITGTSHVSLARPDMMGRKRHLPAPNPGRPGPEKSIRQNVRAGHPANRLPASSKPPKVHGKQGQSETRHSRKEPRGPDGSGHMGSWDGKSVFGKNGGNLDKRWTSVNKNVQNWLISITKAPS